MTKLIYLIGAISFMTIIALFYKSSVISNITEKKEQIAIISRGNGGDMNAASIIAKKLQPYDNIETTIYNTAKLNLGQLNKFEKIIVIGHHAANIVFNNTDQYNVSGKELYVYAHLYNKQLILNIKNIIENNQGMPVHIFVAEFQKMFFYNNPAIQQLLANNQVQIHYSPLIISSYVVNEDITNRTADEMDKLQNLLSEQQVIHLGGSYYNSDGKFVKIGKKEFKESIEGLVLLPNKGLTILFHPRAFIDLKTNNKYDTIQVTERVNFLAQIIKNKHHIANIKFSIPLFILENLDVDNIVGCEIISAPPYSTILNIINEQNTIELGPQLVSVDQYNAFVDIKKVVVPFLLNKDDIEQRAYMSSYEAMVHSGSDLKKDYIIDQIIEKVLNKD